VLKPGCDGHETEAGESARVQRSLHHHDFKRVDALQATSFVPHVSSGFFSEFFAKKKNQSDWQRPSQGKWLYSTFVHRGSARRQHLRTIVF
jgi:hypothetical protein